MKVHIYPSKRKDKKLTALFYKDGEIYKRIHFGAKGYEDYTIHKDEERKQKYLKRHSVRENFNNPYTAGALSRWILWNKPTLIDSINDYKKKFNL